MNQRMLVVLGIVILLVVAIFVGVIPGLDILGSEGYETQTKWPYDNYGGNTQKELLLPEDRKGFITSYRNDLNFGLSETIAVAGNYQAYGGWTVILNYKYIIKWKPTPWSGWEDVSTPEHTENWISVENIGVKPAVLSGSDELRPCEPYVFNIRGQRDGAIRAELWGSFDPNRYNLFDAPEWKLLSSDQAMLHSGKCGMWAPKNENGTYQTVFEIGETVNIKVETGVGAPDIDANARYGEKTWELHLIKPDGNEYTDQSFPRQLQDHYQGTVSFEVYANMWQKGGNNRYKLQLYNTLWKKGTLEVSSIDFKAKMPSKPTIEPDCGLSVEVPGNVHVTISGTPNSDTQLPIQSFGVMVWYGKHSDLAPGSWGEERWILHQTSISASKSGNTYTGSFTFETTSPNRYITIIAYTHDTDGRDSDTEYYQMKTYAPDDPEPDEDDLIDEGGGQGSYGGGSSGETTPFDFWENMDPENYLPLIIAIAVFIITLIIALMPSVPIPYGMIGRLIMVVLGAVLAALIYYFM